MEEMVEATGAQPVRWPSQPGAPAATGPKTANMTSRMRRVGRRPLGSWMVPLLVFAACGRVSQDSAHVSSTFTEDSLISGVVLENVSACEVDADCYLRIAFADTAIVALYGAGERPALPCPSTVEVSNAAFRVQPQEIVEVVISRCQEEGYYLRRLARVTD